MKRKEKELNPEDGRVGAADGEWLPCVLSAIDGVAIRGVIS